MPAHCFSLSFPAPDFCSVAVFILHNFFLCGIFLVCFWLVGGFFVYLVLVFVNSPNGFEITSVFS